MCTIIEQFVASRLKPPKIQIFCHLENTVVPNYTKSFIKIAHKSVLFRQKTGRNKSVYINALKNCAIQKFVASNLK